MFPNAYLVCLLCEAAITCDEGLWEGLQKLEPQEAFDIIKKTVLETADLEFKETEEIIAQQMEHPDFKRYVMGKLGMM
jgi:hypothetical protein